MYYVSASCTMAFALYTVCVSSFATVYGHRLALQGPTGSVDRAVAVMMKQRNAIFVTFGIAMFCLVLAAVAMAWLKMDFARCDHAGKCEVGDGSTPGAITGIFVLFFLALVWKHQDMKGLFNIPRELFPLLEIYKCGLFNCWIEDFLFSGDRLITYERLRTTSKS